MPSNDGLQVAYDSAKYPASNHYSRAAEPEPQNEKTQGQQPSTICGVSSKVFFVTIVVATTVILAVALGAGLGAGLSKSSGSNASSRGSTVSVVTITATPTPAETSASSATSSVASSSSSASSSSIPSSNNSDCPGSNNMNYTSQIFASGANGPVASGAANALTFQKRCGATIPVYQNLAQTHVYSFDSCIDLCAGYNFWHSEEPACTGCTYDYKGMCWIKWGESLGLVESETDASAVLVQ